MITAGRLQILYKLADRMMRNEQDAQEIVHDAFVAYKKHVATDHPPIDDHFKYLYGVVVNKCKNASRAMMGAANTKERYKAFTSCGNMVRTPSAYETAMVEDFLVKHYNRMSPMEKRSFTAVYDIGGYAAMTIAAKEDGQHYESFKTHLANARKKLRKLL